MRSGVIRRSLSSQPCTSYYCRRVPEQHTPRSGLTYQGRRDLGGRGLVARRSSCPPAGRLFCSCLSVDRTVSASARRSSSGDYLNVGSEIDQGTAARALRAWPDQKRCAEGICTAWPASGRLNAVEGIDARSLPRSRTALTAKPCSRPTLGSGRLPRRVRGRAPGGQPARRLYATLLELEPMIAYAEARMTRASRRHVLNVVLCTRRARVRPAIRVPATDAPAARDLPLTVYATPIATSCMRPSRTRRDNM
jgi:hypothetical protein